MDSENPNLVTRYFFKFLKLLSGMVEDSALIQLYIVLFIVYLSACLEVRFILTILVFALSYGPEILDQSNTLLSDFISTKVNGSLDKVEEIKRREPEGKSACFFTNKLVKLMWIANVKHQLENYFNNYLNDVAFMFFKPCITVHIDRIELPSESPLHLEKINYYWTKGIFKIDTHLNVSTISLTGNLNQGLVWFGVNNFNFTADVSLNLGPDNVWIEIQNQDLDLEFTGALSILSWRFFKHYTKKLLIGWIPWQTFLSRSIYDPDEDKVPAPEVPKGLLKLKFDNVKKMEDAIWKEPADMLCQLEVRCGNFIFTSDISSGILSERNFVCTLPISDRDFSKRNITISALGNVSYKKIQAIAIVSIPVATFARPTTNPKTCKLIVRENFAQLNFTSEYRKCMQFRKTETDGILSLDIPDLSNYTSHNYVLEVGISGLAAKLRTSFNAVNSGDENLHLYFSDIDVDHLEVKLIRIWDFSKINNLDKYEEAEKTTQFCLSAMKGTNFVLPLEDDFFFKNSLKINYHFYSLHDSV